MAIYLTSDLHFGHDRDFIYSSRGFKNIYEHDNQIIENWNKIITEEDDVYVLGDLTLGKDISYNEECIHKLRGKLHIIYGNHDTNIRKDIYKNSYNVVDICGWAELICYKNWHFYLSHYPAKTANYDDKKMKMQVYNLCGHAHTKNRFLDFNKDMLSYHVELDAHDNKPVLLDDIIEDIKKYLLTNKFK